MKIPFYIHPDFTTPYPYFSLAYSNWDDYNYKTTFKLVYFYDWKTAHFIGDIKILHNQEKETITIIPRYFNTLPKEFCSLGQDLTFYQNLKDRFPNSYQTILDSLNDVAFFEGTRDNFERLEGFRHSLLRNSEAEKAMFEAKNKILNISFDQNFEFTYKCSIDNVNNDFVVDFNFGDIKELPNRIIAVVGKNGTGKTQFLANLALDLSGKSRKKLKDDVFIPSRPLFSKVIAVSYSAFDKFSRPQSDKTFSYKYCGIKDENGRVLSGTKLVSNFKEAIEKIIERIKYNEWLAIMQQIMGLDLASNVYQEVFHNRNYSLFNDGVLSSGQSFLMYVITEVIASIKPNSLVLFDEPEMHLHPNAIGNLIRMLETILVHNESYAIVATHSPIILQEIPARYVRVFDREGNSSMIYGLGVESFGENIETLTQEVFKTKDIYNSYKQVLKELSLKYSYSEILKLFNDRLSLNAKTYLLNLYDNPEMQLND